MSSNAAAVSPDTAQNPEPHNRNRYIRKKDILLISY